MTATIQRLVSSCFVLALATAGLALPARAEAQSPRQGQQRIAEGTHVWGQDGWCYVMHGGRWVRTNLRRNDARTPPTQPATATRRPTAEEVQLQNLINQLNAQVAVARQQAAARPQTPAPVARGRASGGCANIPLYGPLTPEQKACNDMMVAAIVQSGAHNCEMARAGYPYDAKGNIAAGWYDSLTGVRMKTCR